MTNIETTSGLYFDYLKPKPEQVAVADIARALSHVPRFAGHTTRFYSVAEHALRVADIVGPKSAREQFAALHHDSHEAYLGDLPTPLKALLDDTYRDLRIAADNAIGDKLGIDPKHFHSPIVVSADRLALRVEAAHMKWSHGVGEHWGYDGIPWEAIHGEPRYWTPTEAEELFLYDHDKLCRNLHGRVIR
jgi:hypothetical protein